MPREIEVKSILNKTKRRDPWFLDDYTLNPYSSCSFNCLYCYIRGSKYGTNLESSLSVKSNAVDLLHKQLSNRAKKGQHGIIVMSSATDPYLHVEKAYGLTRKLLEVILEYRFPVHIITKSDLVIRDFDLLKEIEQQAILPEDLVETGSGAIVTFSFSTLDDSVARIFEPGATKPTDRLNAMKLCIDAGFRSGVSFMPQIPYVSDTSEALNHAFQTFQKLKVQYVFPATMTLFGTNQADSKTLMLNAIKKHFPELEAKYLKHFQYGYEMLPYYQKAFEKKMKQMCTEYGLKRSIL